MKILQILIVGVLASVSCQVNAQSPGQVFTIENEDTGLKTGPTTAGRCISASSHFAPGTQWATITLQNCSDEKSKWTLNGESKLVNGKWNDLCLGVSPRPVSSSDIFHAIIGVHCSDPRTKWIINGQNIINEELKNCIGVLPDRPIFPGYYHLTVLVAACSDRYTKWKM